MSTSETRSGTQSRAGETAATFVLLGIFSIMAVAYAVKIFLVARENVDRLDFSHYYTSSYMLRRGIDPYAVDLVPIAVHLGFEAPDVRRASNPPALVLLLEPLTLFRPRVAYWIWFAINVGFLIAFFALTIVEYAVGARTAWALVCLTLMYPPLVTHFRFAQAQIMLLFLLLLTLRFLERKRDAAAGAMLAMAILLKIFPIIMVGHLLARRHWRALAYTVAWAAFGAAVTVSMTGLDTTLNFLKALAFITQPHWMLPSDNISINGFMTRSIGFAVAEGAGRWWLLAERPLFLAAEFGVFATTYLASARPARGGRVDARAFAFWIPAMIMLAPTAWTHYLVLSLIPLWQIAASAIEGRVSRAVFWSAAAGYFSSYAVRLAGLQARVHVLPNAVLFSVVQFSMAPLVLIYLATYWLVRDAAPIEAQ